jgi:hypothetical protein
MHEALGSIPSTTIKQYLKKAKSARCWRLTPIILVTQEAEIRRIEVCSQPGQIVDKTLSPKNPSQKKAGRVTQGVALSSNFSMAKKPKKPKSTFGGMSLLLSLHIHACSQTDMTQRAGSSNHTSW